MSMILAALFFLQTTTEPKKAVEPTKKEAAAHMTAPSRSLMIIEPKARASDYQKAWEMLKQEKSTSKVYFDLVDGGQISNVIDMKMMPNDTLIVFSFSTPQGIRYQVVEVENILGIMHK